MKIWHRTQKITSIGISKKYWVYQIFETVEVYAGHRIKNNRYGWISLMNFKAVLQDCIKTWFSGFFEIMHVSGWRTASHFCILWTDIFTTDWDSRVALLHEIWLTLSFASTLDTMTKPSDANATLARNYNSTKPNQTYNLIEIQTGLDIGCDELSDDLSGCPTHSASNYLSRPRQFLHVQYARINRHCLRQQYYETGRRKHRNGAQVEPRMARTESIKKWKCTFINSK